MAVCNREYTELGSDYQMSFSLTERSIYGSSRIANNTEPVVLVSLDQTVSGKDLMIKPLNNGTTN